MMLLRARPISSSEILKVLGYVAIGNCGVAIAITYLFPTGGSLWVNFVYSQAIGLSICALCGVTQGLIGVERTLPLWLMVLVMGATSVVGFLLGGALGTLLLGLPGDFLSSWAAMDHLMQLIFVTLCASLSFGVFFWIRRRVDQLQLEAAQERERAETAARQAAEARLAVLRAQIEPHMLFNTLANLRALIVLDPAAAQHMLDRLIAFMRATLSSSRSERVSLQAEFTLIDDYLHLIGIRMGERLRHRLDLPTTLASVTTLPLLLQPLVENAVRHGLEPAEQGGEIEVSARRLGDRLELSVTNSGAPFRAERDAQPTGRRLAAGADGTVHQEDGFGLSQIRQRLQTAYGDAAKLEIRAAQAGDGCRVTLILPLVEAVPASASPSSPSSPSSGA